MVSFTRAIRVGLMVTGCATMLVGCGKAHPAGTPTTGKAAVPMSTPVQGGFDQDENFCAQRPLLGKIAYVARSGRVSMDVTVTGLPPKSVVGINWANNTVRGYQVGTITTDRSGAAVSASLHLYRPGETRGYRIVLTTPALSPKVLGTLWPCGPPPIGPAAVVTDPVVTVTPQSGLTDGKEVRVSVSGFGESGKVFLSECDHAEDATVLGCGPQLALQPFILTGSDRSGSATFVVHSSAASESYDTTLVEPCTSLCVIVATQGDAAWAVVPIAFGSSQLVRPNG